MTDSTSWIVFTWELRKKSRQRRWFYTRLERILLGLPQGSWRKLGGSVYLVETQHSPKFEELLGQLDEPDLSWHKLKVDRENF